MRRKRTEGTERVMFSSTWCASTGVPNTFHVATMCTIPANVSASPPPKSPWKPCANVARMEMLWIRGIVINMWHAAMVIIICSIAQDLDSSTTPKLTDVCNRVKENAKKSIPKVPFYFRLFRHIFILVHTRLMNVFRHYFLIQFKFQFITIRTNSLRSIVTT